MSEGMANAYLSLELKIFWGFRWKKTAAGVSDGGRSQNTVADTAEDWPVASADCRCKLDQQLMDTGNLT